MIGALGVENDDDSAPFTPSPHVQLLPEISPRQTRQLTVPYRVQPRRVQHSSANSTSVMVLRVAV